MSEQRIPSRLLVPALLFVTMSVNVSSSILGLFMVDIGSTFHVTVGVASQLLTVNQASGFISALLMGALVVRFRYKPLILAGMLLVIFSAIGSFLAPDFVTMEVFFAVAGVGAIMFAVMSRTLIGDVFALQRRTKAVSYLMATSIGGALISYPLSGFLAAVAGWRSNFVLQMLPIALVGSILALLTVPSKLRSAREVSPVEKTSIVEGFRRVLKDKSATACLVSQILAEAAAVSGIFAIAFFRERLSVSVDFSVLILMVMLAFYTAGSLVGGRLTNRFGAKPINVSSTFGCAAFLVIMFLMPNTWGALISFFAYGWFGGIAVTAYLCLAVAQVPKSRGTMMSLNSAVESAAHAIGPALGGALLILTLGFYGAIGFTFGGLFVLSALMRLFWVKDPIRT